MTHKVYHINFQNYGVELNLLDQLVELRSEVLLLV